MKDYFKIRISTKWNRVSYLVEAPHGAFTSDKLTNIVKSYTKYNVHTHKLNGYVSSTMKSKARYLYDILFNNVIDLHFTHKESSTTTIAVAEGVLYFATKPFCCEYHSAYNVTFVRPCDKVTIEDIKDLFKSEKINYNVAVNGAVYLRGQYRMTNCDTIVGSPSYSKFALFRITERTYTKTTVTED